MGAVLWRYKVRLAAITLELIAIGQMLTGLYLWAVGYVVIALLLSVVLEHGDRSWMRWAGL